MRLVKFNYYCCIIHLEGLPLVAGIISIDVAAREEKKENKKTPELQHRTIGIIK